MADPSMNPELANAIVASAKRLGVDPLHIATAMSYETGGTMNPNLWGGKDRNYLGLIQFGPEERRKYGVHEGMSTGDQVVAAENFLRDRGVKPGMGLPDIYSTINAGSPGRYNASDANNGGAPGTVMDKVTTQMAPHMANASRLLGMPQVGMINAPGSGGTGAPVAAGTATPSAGPAATPTPPADDGSAALMSQLQAIPKMLAARQQNQVYAPPAPVVNNMAARLAAIAAARQQGSMT